MPPPPTKQREKNQTPFLVPKLKFSTLKCNSKSEMLISNVSLDSYIFHKSLINLKGTACKYKKNCIIIMNISKTNLDLVKIECVKLHENQQ